MAGTSLAAPHFAASAALVWSKATHYDNMDVIDLLVENVTEIPAMAEKCSSGGRLDLPKALEALYQEYRSAYSKGDLNGDGYVTADDKTICKSISRGAVSATSQQVSAGDLDGDGNVTTADYILIGNYLSRTNYFAP